MQVRYLADRAQRWINAVRRINSNLNSGAAFSRLTEVRLVDQESDPWNGLYDDVHFLCLALKHLDTCLRILNEAGFHVGYDEKFRVEWGKLSALRDAIEHEEEYAAGTGRRAQLVGSGWDPWGETAIRASFTGDGLYTVTVLGKTYEVRDAIRAALQMASPYTALSDLTMRDWRAMAETEQMDFTEWIFQNAGRINRGELEQQPWRAADRPTLP